MANTHKIDTTECDIAIVGGGMVGLSLALLINKYAPGLAVKVFDSYPMSSSSDEYKPSFDARSTALSSNSADIFRDVGIWNEIVCHTTPIRQVHVSDRGHPGCTEYSDKDNHGDALGFVVENQWLGQQLASGVKLAKNIEAFAPANVHSLKFMSGGARLSAEVDGVHRVFNCRLVVVADGAESGLRDSLGIATHVHDYQQSAIIANVEFEHSHECIAYERFTPSGPLALLPLGESEDAKKSALVWTTPQQKVDEVLAWSDDTFLRELQNVFGHRLGKLVRVGTRYQYPLKRILAKEQVRTGLVLMGNAAHFLHPVAGQGFNLALRDCEELAKQLSDAVTREVPIGSLDMLQSYEEKQRNDQWLTTFMSHSFNRMFLDKRAGVQALSTVGLLSLNVFPSAKKTFFDQMMGKGILT